MDRIIYYLWCFNSYTLFMCMIRLPLVFFSLARGCTLQQLSIGFYVLIFVLQPFVAWTVDQMEFVNPVNAAVILAMLEIYAINCLVIHVVLNMANAKTEHASARKDGMAATAHCVSIFIYLFIFVYFNFPKKISPEICKHTTLTAQQKRITLCAVPFGPFNTIHIFYRGVVFFLFSLMKPGEKARDTYSNSLSCS